MVHDPRVPTVLARLGGVYRDPARVDRDAASLLGSSVGAHLAPTMCALDGVNVLTMQGTIAMHFRGNTYQLLMDIFLPPRYPNQPPSCYVRLASESMYLKQNHKHVDATGKVYLPYLHEWNRASHNLIELVVVMSSVFSNEPPVFTRASGAGGASSSSATSSSSNTPQSTQPTPPPSLPLSTSSWQPTPPPPPSQSSSNNNEEEETRAAILQVQMAEAAEASRQSDQQASKELERTVMIKSQLDDKIRRYLLQQISELQTLQQADSTQEKQLEWASEQKIVRQLEYFTRAKTELEQHLAATELSIQEIQDWLQHAEANSQQETQQSSIQVVPTSPHDAQLLDLEATNASLADALYFLDRALYQGQLDSEQHLKQVRQCAKQQFLVRAHLMKIQKQTEF